MKGQREVFQGALPPGPPLKGFALKNPIAAMKNHLGIYPTARGISAFADRLTEYKTSKGAIQIPWDKPVPYDLIAEITRLRVSDVKGKKP